MAQKRLCAYLIIQLSLEPDKIATSAWSQSILLLILHILVPSFTFLLQSKAKLLFLVKAENTGKKDVVILGTFFTSVGVENFFGVSGTLLEYNASGKPLLCLNSLKKQFIPGLRFSPLISELSSEHRLTEQRLKMRDARLAEVEAKLKQTVQV